jgi:hypothetical protein
VLEKLAASAAIPVEMDMCGSLADVQVTLVTTGPEELGGLLHALAVQLGVPVRLFVGQHAEVARPTLFCPRDKSDTLATIGSATR